MVRLLCKTMNDAYSIRLAKTELRDGYNTGDVDRILSVFSDGWAICPPVVLHFGGRRRRRFCAIGSSECSQSIAPDWPSPSFQFGSLATGHLTGDGVSLTLTPRKGGRPKKVRTRYVEIWVKEADGKWRIAIFLDNIDLPPQMPPREVLAAMRPKRLRSKSRSAARVRE